MFDELLCELTKNIVERVHKSYPKEGVAEPGTEEFVEWEEWCAQFYSEEEGNNDPYWSNGCIWDSLDENELEKRDNCKRKKIKRTHDA